MNKKLPPIFILGCPRSGSTLLRLLLDSHSSIACPPESKFILHLVNILEIDQAHEGLKSMGFSEEHISSSIRAFIESFFYNYCHKKGKKRWAEKTPHNLDHAQTIDQIFNSEPLYIGIIRHGLDVAHSLQGFDWGIIERKVSSGISRPEAGIEIWVEQNEKLNQAANAFGERYFQIRYEALTKNPETELMKLMAFLKEDWEPEMLNYHEHAHDYGFGDKNVHKLKRVTHNSGKYHQWPKSLQNHLFEIGRNMFDALSYEIGH